MKRRLISLSLIAVAVGITAPVAVAQAPGSQRPNALRGLDDVAPGTKLRVVTLTNPPERIEGRLVSVQNTSFSLQLRGSGQRELSVLQLLRVDEAYRDRPRGAIAGVIPGLVGVYAWDYFGSHARYPDQQKRYRENVTALAVTCGVGALIGAVVGWQRWRPLQTSAR